MLIPHDPAEERRPRNRAWYIALALGTILLGLVVHWRGAALGPNIQDVVADALWAAMIAWWIGALAPGTSLRVRFTVALALCACVEMTQLYHAPWLDALRGTTAGRLVLGNAFDPRDLAAYAAGVLAAAILETAILRRHGGGVLRPPPRAAT